MNLPASIAFASSLSLFACGLLVPPHLKWIQPLVVLIACISGLTGLAVVAQPLRNARVAQMLFILLASTGGTLLVNTDDRWLTASMLSALVLAILGIGIACAAVVISINACSHCGLLKWASHGVALFLLLGAGLILMAIDLHHFERARFTFILSSTVLISASLLGFEVCRRWQIQCPTSAPAWIFHGLSQEHLAAWDVQCPIEWRNLGCLIALIVGIWAAWLL